MATQATTLHQALTTLGVERASRDLDLADYLESKEAEARAQGANGNDPDVPSADVLSPTPSDDDGGDMGGVLAPRAVAHGRGGTLDDRQQSRSTTPPGATPSNLTPEKS
jgi:hypothetical protein